MKKDDVDIDAMTDEEVEFYIQEMTDRQARKPREHEKKGGASIEYSLVLLVCSIFALFASAQLLLEERKLLLDPRSSLACDINPIIGCSTFLSDSYSAVLWNIPNALWGVMFFSGLIALSLALLSGARFHHFLWRLINVGMVGALTYVVWFQYISFFVKHGMCPYCLLVWFSTLPIIIHTWIRSYQAQRIIVPHHDAAVRILVKYRWLIVALVYAVLLICILVIFWDKWLLLYG
ncbi:MAG: hypothetical protein J6M18_06580 [Actinomycetaceae bacterium]|nr:hypothetical protein [Actinomycetaceae bacterium]